MARFLSLPEKIAGDAHMANAVFACIRVLEGNSGLGLSKNWHRKLWLLR